MKPTCMNCEKKPARKLSLFCTNKCGSIYADEINANIDTLWCPKKSAWSSLDTGLCHECGEDPDDHPHPTAYSLVVGEEG